MRPGTVGAVARVPLSLASINNLQSGGASPRQVEITLPDGKSITCLLRPVARPQNLVVLAGTTVGGDVFNAGRGTVIHLGAEQRYGPFAVRGGVARDERKKLQFGFGGGLRMGAFGLDLGVWTHSNTLADQRAMTMATSISVY